MEAIYLAQISADCVFWHSPTNAKRQFGKATLRKVDRETLQVAKEPSSLVANSIISKSSSRSRVLTWSTEDVKNTTK